MYRQIAVAVIGVTVLVGCGARSPVAPETALPDQQMAQLSGPTQDGPYRLWGEWTFYFNADHDRVDVVPHRQGRFHLNALKWLEEDCADCLMITNIRNNGDSTIDLTVRIRHPKPGQPELTGFDVKGIIMFNGSHEIPFVEPFPLPPYFSPFRISWREVGDPELLNADGYTVRWSPSYESGSSLPLLNYWPGKYSSGTPTANLNAYLNFYVTEDRHMFTHTGVVTRVYHIYLPPGPVVAGYAVEACWAPPTKTPVTNPLDDFPITANQDEPYYLRYVVNNDEPITQPCCGGGDDPCLTLRLDALQWGGETINVTVTRYRTALGPWLGTSLTRCPMSYPDSFKCTSSGYSGNPDGNYRGVLIAYRDSGFPDQIRDQIAHTVFDFTVDLE